MEKMNTDFKNNSFTILSAEDDDDYFRLLNILITRELKIEKLIHAIDGEELTNYLSKCAKENSTEKWPDLILLDLNMPRKNGLDALKEIRANNAIPLIPIVVFTISSDSKDIHEAYNFGANAFVTKPTDLPTLISTLKSVVEYWQNLKHKTLSKSGQSYLN